MRNKRKGATIKNRVDLSPLRKVLFGLFLFSVLSVAHPKKVSFILIRYTPEQESAYMELKVFVDDLQLAIKDEMAAEIGTKNWNEPERKLVNAFIQKHVQLSFGRQSIDLAFCHTDYTPSNNLMTLKYELSSLPLSAGEQVSVSNTLFFKQFPRDQVNRYELQIPKVVEATLVCRNERDCAKTYTVKP